MHDCMYKRFVHVNFHPFACVFKRIYVLKIISLLYVFLDVRMFVYFFKACAQLVCMIVCGFFCVCVGICVCMCGEFSNVCANTRIYMCLCHVLCVYFYVCVLFVCFL